ncbi:MAG: S8 family serine peptidase [Phaeodactylibacter sp.]|uniref:S8 family serine peptidase n=1 Tax=Phaeodactylibacter sp. TaxID=1940289 RepID=UPI0032ED21E0
MGGAKRIKFYLFLVCWACAALTNAQSVPGEVLVQLMADKAPEQILRAPGFTYRETLSRSARIHLLSYDTLRYSLPDALKRLNQQPGVALAQPNHRLQLRDTIPTDPLFPQQWQWLNLSEQNSLPDADVDADLAWSLPSFGPTTALGDTIVIAVLDDGIQADHPDLAPNLWRNHHEIPNNHIDDDQNGYVDDHRGWNPTLGSDHIHQGYHGTPVAGMIAAAWQNGTGGTGIAPQIKIMVVAGSSQTEADAIAAYAYVLEQRLRYNETQGAQGAFVVATNTSWGINGLSPAEAPIWCQFYDELGAAGILNCAATANPSWNIDEVGDMPTACSSPYLLTVTASNRMDECTGAYGPVAVDLAAPGREVFTTHPGSIYGWSSGTSFASPIAAGAVALLYSSACSDLGALAHNDPAAAALEAKALLLNTTDPAPGMAGQTVTGGRLNAYRALEELALNCTPCQPVLDLAAEEADEQELLLTWTNTGPEDANTLLWRPAGANEWQEVPEAIPPVALHALLPCTRYEIKIARQCADSQTAFSPTIEVWTSGCCLPPGNVSATALGNTGATLSWDTNGEPLLYQIQVQDETGWIFNTTHHGGSLQLSGLSPCTAYKAMIAPVCQNEDSNSVEFRFVTEGCGSCTDLSYCTSYGGTSGTEWIDAVTFGDQYHLSGLNEGTPLFPTPGFTVGRGQTVPLSIRPGFQHIAFPEYIRVWIDLDQDGQFAPTAELLLDTLLLPAQDSLSTTLLIPGNALPGTTRMRVSLKWAGFGSMKPLPCEPHIHFGEVEDYCVDILEQLTPSQTSTLQEEEALRVWPNPFGRTLQLQHTSVDDQAAVQLIGIDGKVHLEQEVYLSAGQSLRLQLPEALPAGWYLLRARIAGRVYRKPVLHH